MHIDLTHYKEIFHTGCESIEHSENFCKSLREQDENQIQSVTKSYVLPLLLVIAICIFISYFIHTRNGSFSVAILRTLLNVMALGAGYFGAVLVCRKSTEHFFQSKLSLFQAENVIAYSMTSVFGVYIVIALFPSLFFTKLLMLQSLYILWCMANEYLQLDEKYRTSFMLLNTATIILFPYIALKLLRLLIPNVAI